MKKREQEERLLYRKRQTEERQKFAEEAAQKLDEIKRAKPLYLQKEEEWNKQIANEKAL